MITEQDLATLTIERVIIHDIPKKKRGGDEKPSLSDTDSPLDVDTTAHLHRKLVETIGGKSAYELDFADPTESPVPEIVRDYTAGHRNQDDFIEKSRRLANYLFELQGGTSSAGLLCVLDCTVTNRRAICILKVERESGASLNATTVNGKRTLKMSMVRNILLPTGTKLFKNALFLRGGNGEFLISGCDTQRANTNVEMAQFWSRFLGCQMREVPRIATKRFLDINIEYIDHHIENPVTKADWYSHVTSELTSKKRRISPRAYIDDYVPEEHRVPFEELLKQRRFPLKAFDLDTSDVKNRLRRLLYRTRNGAHVSVPFDKPELVQIETERIVILDSLSTVGRQ